MTSLETQAGERRETVFVPFWVLLQVLDSAEYDPFVECRILKQYSTKFLTPDWPNDEEIEVYDLEIKEGLIAEAVPITYAVKRQDLKTWARKIADWILEFPEELDAEMF